MSIEEKADRARVLELLRKTDAAYKVWDANRTERNRAAYETALCAYAAADEANLRKYFGR